MTIPQLDDQLALEAMLSQEADPTTEFGAWALLHLSDPTTTAKQKATLLRAFKRAPASFAMLGLTITLASPQQHPEVTAAAFDCLEHFSEAGTLPPEWLEDTLSRVDRSTALGHPEVKDQFIKLLVSCGKLDEISAMARGGDIEAIDALGTARGEWIDEVLADIATLGGPEGSAATRARRHRAREISCSIAHAALESGSSLDLAEVQTLYEHEQLALLDRLAALSLLTEEQRRWLARVLESSPVSSQKKMRRKLARSVGNQTG